MKRWLINAFIVFHLFALGLWSLPSFQLRNIFLKPVENYVLYTGLWHVWDMFAPMPLRMNFRLDAEIVYQDGTRSRWDFPRMDKLGILERYQKERWRKYGERVRLDAYRNIWEVTAQYIARLHKNPLNPPVAVSLTRHWEEVPMIRMDREYQPPLGPVQYAGSYTFYSYRVQPKDLQ